MSRKKRDSQTRFLYADHRSFPSDSRTGGIVLKKSVMPRNFLTKSILLVTPPRVRGLHGTVAYDRFGQVHGIRMRICPRNMLEYSSLKNSGGQNGMYLEQQRVKV